MNGKSHIFSSDHGLVLDETWPLPDREAEGSLDAGLSSAQRQRLVAALDGYVADLERGVRRDPEELYAEHPDLAEALREYLASLNVLQRAASLCRSAPADEPPQLGDYRILRELGRGGMGIVYEARQISLGRTVALKVLPFAGVLDQKEVIRFQNEAQAAAQLHHPHIVPVYAVGCERGVHYYSMQFIDGRPLDQAIAELRGPAGPDGGVSRRRSGTADGGAAGGRVVGCKQTGGTKNGRGAAIGGGGGRDAVGREAAAGDAARGVLPGTTARVEATLRSAQCRNHIQGVVELGIQAAEALQHAHECGVVHRDIKPSNLLIDRQGKLWISDFGLARLESRSQLTLPGDVFGTLRYMSPEQAAGRVDLVDGRSDIYSLGVTLYEALTLRVPFDATARTEMLRLIAHAEPPSPRRFNPSIPADLETIVLKSLAKSREDRYATAADLAADLRRFRDGQPTLARRPTWVERGVKWVARRARLVAVALVVLLLGSSGLAVATLLVAQAHRRTMQALQEAERHLHVAQGVVDDFSVRYSEELALVPGAEPVRAAALARAETFYRDLIETSASSPARRHDAAMAAFQRASVLEQLGRLDEADQAYRRARERFGHLAAAFPGDADTIAESALCDGQYALLLARRGDPAAAQRLLSDALYALEGLAGGSPSRADLQEDLTLMRLNYATLLLQDGRDDEARRLLLENEAVLRSVAPGADEPWAGRLALTLEQLASAAELPRQAYAWLEESVAIHQRRVGRAPRDPRILRELAGALHRLGSLQQELRERQEALATFRQALALRRELAAQAPRVLTRQAELAATLNNLGLAHWPEHVGPAAELFREAAARLQEVVAASPDDFEARSELAVTLGNQGMTAERQGRLQESMDLLQRAIDEQQLAYERSGRQARLGERLNRHQSQLQRVRNAAAVSDGTGRRGRAEGPAI